MPKATKASVCRTDCTRSAVARKCVWALMAGGPAALGWRTSWDSTGCGVKMPQTTTRAPAPVEAHILVVDDDLAIRELIREYLTENDFQVSVAESGADMDRVLGAEIVDLVILDLKLPDEDGLAIARRLRESLDLPIIILTGRKEEADRVMGLELGADDYVTKPFSQRELLARIKAVLRRTEGKRAARRGANVRAFRFAGWELSTGTRKLKSPDGRNVELTNSEYA